MMSSESRRDGAGRLSAAELEPLAGYGAKAVWPAGFTIYQRSAAADGIFVVLRGRVVLRSRVKAGRGFVPAIAGVGETFGAEGLAGGGVYATDARAEEESETLHLSGVRYRAFAREQPQHALALVGQVMQQYAVLLEKLRELATLSVEQRLVTTLARMSQQQAPGAGNGQISLDGGQYRLLCEMVGATRESVSIVVNRLIADGLAERQGAGFVVPSLDDLLSRSGTSRDGELAMQMGIESELGGDSAR